jgi:sulfatase maturation enzyme AslB (radical SAM superfamily)
MEFRGGEVFADKHSVDFMWEIARTDYAKNIELDISTNTTLITEDIVDLLNHFKGGLLRFSIDGHNEQDELIRAHTNWDSVVSSINNATKLHEHWNTVTQQCLQTLNCLNMTEVLEFVDNYCRTNNNTRFHIGITSIRGKDWLRHELVPLELREKEIERLENFIKTSWLCNVSHHKKAETEAVQGLITALRNPDYTDPKLFKMAKEYYLKLSELRGVDYWKVFPHLEFLNREE